MWLFEYITICYVHEFVICSSGCIYNVHAHCMSYFASGAAGYVWAQQPNGALFFFNPQRSVRMLKVVEVTSPEPDAGEPAVCLCVALDVVWVLMRSGNVYVRSGMHANCPQGVRWMPLDLTQLGRESSLLCALI